MMYSFRTLEDGTEIVHSEMLSDYRVRVYLKKPDEKDCFHHAICVLPDCRWEKVAGFTKSEIQRYQAFLAGESSSILSAASQHLIPNEETVAAIKEVAEIKKYPSRYKHYKSFSELLSDVDSDSK